jgi:hypothetical protein
MPTQIMGAFSTGMWFPRTTPKIEGRGPLGIQQFPFSGTSMFNAGNIPQIVPCNLSLHDGEQRTSHSFVVEAWTDRDDLGVWPAERKGRMLATSNALTYTFDDAGFSRGLSFDKFKATDVAPGWVSIVAEPNNATIYAQAKQVTWTGFAPPPEPPVGAATTEGDKKGGALPVFTLNEAVMGDQYTTRSQPAGTSAVFSVSQPGIHFVGIYGAWNGQYGFSSPKPENGIRTYSSFPLVVDKQAAAGASHTFQPIAIITPWENGTVPKLPRDFAGAVHNTGPIPGDWRLALRISKVTVFDGGMVALRCVHGPARPNGGKFAFQAVEIDAPTGLTVLWKGMCKPGAAQSSGQKLCNVTDVSLVPGGGKVPSGYTRWRLSKPPASEWSYLNEAVELRFEVVDTQLTGKTFPHARIRGYSGPKNQQRSDNWQALAMTVKSLVPVPMLPKRLHTSYCWGGPKEFVDDSSHHLSSIATWKSLGFNTIPTDGASYSTQPDGPGGLLPPSNRTGKDWDGMRYGIMGSPFGTSGFSAPPHGLGCFKALKMPRASAHSAGKDGFNFTKVGLTAAEEAVERDKWDAALKFHDEWGQIDLVRFAPQIESQS